MHRLYKKQQNQAAAGLYLFLSKRKKKAGQNLLLLAVKGKELFPDNACNTCCTLTKELSSSGGKKQKSGSI